MLGGSVTRVQVKPTQSTSVAVAPDGIIMDRLERIRSGANTHFVSNLRQTYLGAFELVQLCGREGDHVAERDAVRVFTEAERRIECFLGGLL